MNTFTRSSIELISSSVYSGVSRPTTRCFLFFGLGFHTRVESLYFYPKISLKYIRTIFRNLFYEDSIRQSSTSYKLSKNNINYMTVISHFLNMSNKKITSAFHPRPYGMTFPAGKLINYKLYYANIYGN